MMSVEQPAEPECLGGVWSINRPCHGCHGSQWMAGIHPDSLPGLVVADGGSCRVAKACIPLYESKSESPAGMVRILRPCAVPPPQNGRQRSPTG
jgi:hypothetical protein